MTPQTITLTHLPDILLVVVPEEATNLQVVTIHQGSKSFPSLKYDRRDLVRGYIDLPTGTWEIVGRLSEVTEAEADKIVPFGDADPSGDKYVVGRRLFDSESEEPYLFWNDVTALESLESAILAEGYTFQSPPKPENKDFYWGYLDDLAKWEAEQPRVLSRERCLLLRRADG